MSQAAECRLEARADSAAMGVRTDTLAESVVLLAAMSILQRLIGFGRSFLFCRWLDPADLGRWEMALGFIALASPVVVLGLPGSFVRYTEHFRQRGQLRTFIRRTTWVSILCAAIGVTVLAWTSPTFARLVFGTSDQAQLMLLLALSLIGVTAFNVVGQLLVSLRLYRYQSVLQFLQTLLFAAISITLLVFWRDDVTGIVLAYGGSMVAAFAIGMIWMRRAWRGLPEATHALPHHTLWAKLVPFALWVWIGNWLANLFLTVDRYMILHVSGLDSADAVRVVGQYHSAAVLPMVLVGFGGVLGGILTPHLSHDWEAGRRAAVHQRMSLTIKLLGLTLFAASIAVLFIAPWLFNVGFKGKYADGLDVLPLALTYCTWLAMSYVAAAYLWCAEKAHLSSIAMFLGLMSNVVLNLLLLPRYGLMGAVLATSMANLISLAGIYLLSHTADLRLGAGVWLITALPVVYWFGPMGSLAVLLAVSLLALSGERVLNRAEKDQVAEVWSKYVSRLRAWTGTQHRR